MELKPATTSAWVPGILPPELKPGQARAVLIFGPDLGGVFEFARLAGAADDDLQSYPAADVSADDVVSSLSSGSLFGGATSVRLDDADDKSLKKIEQILDAPFTDGARLILTAGDLKKTSKLRKLFEARTDCVSAPLYLMKDREIAKFAQTFFKAEGLGIDRDTTFEIQARLSGDRATAARACEVVALHAFGRSAASVSVADLRAVLDTVDEDGILAPLDHALSGKPGDASIAITRRLSSGESFVGMLRVFSMRMFRLRAMLEGGLSAQEAVARAKPPVFWTEKDATIRILNNLSVKKVDIILDMIDQTEFRIIEQGIPAEAAMPALMIDVSRQTN